MRWLIPFTGFFITILLISAPAVLAGAEHASVRFGHHPDHLRIVIDLATPPASFRAFTLNQPDRIVVDLPPLASVTGTPDPASAKIIKGLRHAPLDAATTRLVFDTAGPVKILRAFALPADESQAARLVIDIAAAAALPPSAPGIPSPAVTENTAMPIPTPAAKPVPASKKIVVLDAGHGGHDPGALAYNGLYEKHITLAVAKTLRRRLESTGRYTVVMTRETDRFLKLYERVDKGRQARGDLFISLHADTINKNNVRGSSIYTLSEKASDETSALLAEQENRVDLLSGVDLSHEQPDVANILLDLAMREAMNESKRFANFLVETLQAETIRLLPNPHRSAGFAVLKAPDIPSVLIELGFLSSPREADLLATPAYQEELADAIARGIDRYFAAASQARDPS